jgi:hypothetical protein
VVDRLLVPLEGGWRVVLALAVVWATVALAVAPLKAGKKVPLVGAAAASLDGVGPPALGRVSARTGMPMTATLAGGLVATATTLAAFAVAGDDNSRYLSVALTLSISLLALANLAVFPALVRLRRTHPTQPRAFRVPGGPAGVLAVSVLATGWSAVALAASLWPGLGTGDPMPTCPTASPASASPSPWPPCSWARSCWSVSAVATNGPWPPTDQPQVPHLIAGPADAGRACGQPPDFTPALGYAPPPGDPAPDRVAGGRAGSGRRPGAGEATRGAVVLTGRAPGRPRTR